MNLHKIATIDNVYRAACDYAEMGISVIPLRGKIPALNSWAEFQSRRASLDEVKQWWETDLLQNVGLVLGDVSGGLVCVDLDGQAAVDTFLGDFEGIENTTFSVKSGNGLHLYFITEEPTKTTKTTGYELRSNGLYMVAPPSIHPSGRRYQVINPDPARRVQNLDEVAAWISARKPGAKEQTRYTEQRQPVTDTAGRYAAAAIAGEVGRVASALPGTRNDTLNGAAYNLGQLVGGGVLDDATARAELVAAARVAGLSDHEADRTIESGLQAGRLQPRQPDANGSRSNGSQTRRADQPAQDEPAQDQPAGYIKPDDDQIAGEVAARWRGQYAHFYGDWHVYEDGAWRRRADAEIKQNVRRELRHYRQYGVQVSQSRVTGVSQMLADDLYTPDRTIKDAINEQAKYINCTNGLLNLETGELEQHRPDVWLTNQVGFPYDPDAEWGAWLSYLRSSLVLPDLSGPDWRMIELLQEAIGYSLTASTELKASFWVIGKPDSGKSTLVNVLRQLAGELHTTIDLNQLATNRFLLAGIVGKRIVTFTEADAATPIPDAIYKAMVGGQDEIWVDVKNKPGISFVPTAKFWWAMNEAPRIRDRTGATFNRLQVLLFNRSIPTHERDARLPARLSAQLPGIFAWAVNGLQRLRRRGSFVHVDQSAQWLADFQREQDTELQFFEERCFKSDGIVQAQTLYNAYADYCRANGFRAKNISQVSRDWERLGLHRVNYSGVKHWRGLSIDANN